MERKIPALAQVTKSGFMYILDRTNGHPVFGVTETPVDKSNVPGEVSYPTQPIPVKPPPISRVSMTRNDIVTAADTTPEHAKACLELWDKFGGLHNAGAFTTFPFHPAGATDTQPAIVFPGATGGANWGGTAVDPKLGYVFVNTKDSPLTGWMEKNPKYDPANPNGLREYIRSGPAGLGAFNAQVRDAQGRLIGSWPCYKPPWGRLIAVNAQTGDFAWSVPLGITDSLAREGKQNTGIANTAGPMATAGGLVFIRYYQRQPLPRIRFEDRQGTVDSKTGVHTATAVPMTFLGKNGKQYVAIVAASGGAGGGRGGAGGGNQGLVVFSLP